MRSRPLEGTTSKDLIAWVGGIAETMDHGMSRKLLEELAERLPEAEKDIDEARAVARCLYNALEVAYIVIADELPGQYEEVSAEIQRALKNTVALEVAKGDG